MRALFMPGIQLMNRLKYPGKFLLVGLVLLFPLIVVLSQFVIGVNADIEFSSKERVGLVYNTPLLTLLQHVQEHNTLTVVYQQGDSSVLTTIQQLQTTIGADLAAIDRIDQQYGAYLQVQTQWAALKSEWTTLQNQVLSLNPAEALNQHLTLIQNIHHLIIAVGNYSNLILDPDLDTYYLMDVVINKQPLTVLYAGELQAYAAEVPVRGNLTAEDRARFTIMGGLLANALTQMETSYQYTFATNPGVQDRLQPAITMQRIQIQTWLDFVMQRLLGMDQSTVSLTDFLTVSNQALAASFDLYHATSPVLDELIQQRVDRYVTTRNLTILITLVALGAAIYLFTTFYLAVKRTIAKLSETSEKMIAGQSARELVLENRDELAEVAIAFNNIAGELLTTRDRALEANRAKSTFLANMSHELRTPLNAIIGYSELIEEEAIEEENDHYVSDLQKIQSAAKHLLALINDILDFSKIEAGKMELYLENISMDEMLHDIQSTVQPLMKRNQNEYLVEATPNLGTLFADHTKIRQVLFNLLSNASKFTKNGKITLKVTRQTTPNGDEFVFEVRDTGLGMTEAQMQKLFQEFSQADASTTRKFGGTGLGLVISKRFCEMMGGDIQVASQLNVGSTFTVRLPAKVAKAETSFPEQRSSGSARVMVVDDDPAALDMMGRFLERAGYEVLMCRNGEEALTKVREFAPDVITLDVMMPVMDGWTVLNKLKSDKELSTIPVVMLTVLQDKNMGYTLGAADYLTKPFERDQLLAVLRKYEASGDKNTARILVVEDDQHTRDMVARTLSKEGWQVDTAPNGREGLFQFAQRPYTLVLLDLMMPIMDGFEFLAQLRQQDNGKDVPVLVVTAMDLNEEERGRLTRQVDRILQKGAYGREQFLTEVQQMVNRMTQR